MTAVALVITHSDELRARLESCISQVDASCRVISANSVDALPALDASAKVRLVAVDFEGPPAQGSATLRVLVDLFPGTPLTAIAESVDAPGVDSALRAGALAYIPKSYSDRQLQLVLELALSGVGHRPHLLAQQAPAAPMSPMQPGSASAIAAGQGEPLTAKQVEVLSYAATGLSNRQIAVRLKIAESTVKLHMNSIYRKLNVERRGEAIVLAQRMEAVRRQQVEHGQRGGELVLDWLLPHVGHRHCKQGEVLFRKGDPGRELFYLQRGQVSLDEIGVEMGPGQIFGEIGVFAPDRARTSTARCLTDVELFCLTSEQVKSIYYLNPQFALHIVTLLAQRLVDERMH